MTNRRQSTETRRQLLAFLAALVGVLAFIGLFGAASANERGVSQNRVGAINVAGAVLVEPPQGESPGQRLGKAALGRHIVVATGVAAKAGSGALRSVDEALSGLPKGDQSWVRLVPDEGSLTAKFSELTKGGTPTTWNRYNGTVIERGDGVQVGIRSSSRSGGGAIDIRMPDGSRIRIHVEQP